VKSRLLRARLQLRERLGKFFEKRVNGKHDIGKHDNSSGDGDQ